MLVLTRRASQKVCFPNLGISVGVLSVKGKTIRLGIDAPDDVKVLRQELVECGFSGMGSAPIKRKLAKLSHDERNRLNTAMLALHLTQKQIDAGFIAEAEANLQKALRQFQIFEEEIGATQSQPTIDAGTRRALLVEDDANERELLAGILRMSGFTVDTARDGLAALGYLNKHELPDVVLMDMRMPRLDGPKTISAIRRTRNFAGVKLIAVSASDPCEFGVETGPQGIDRWFSKPLNASSLVAELDRELTSELN